MKKYMALLLLMIAIPAHPAEPRWFETKKPVTCGPFREIVELITNKDFQEQPVWIGHSENDTSAFALFRNPSTGTWTLVQYGSQTGCVLGMGKSENVYQPDVKN